MKKIVLFSGAREKISFLASAGVLVRKQDNPELYVGTSSGAAVAAALALGVQDDVIEDILLEIDISDIWNDPPDSLWSRAKTAFQVLRGKDFLFSHENLRNTLKKILTEDKFLEWKDDPNRKKLVVGFVTYPTYSVRYPALEKRSYEGFISCILASMSIPVIAPSVEIDGREQYDGGLIDHIGEKYLEKRIKSGCKIDKVICVYSRPDMIGSENKEIPLSMDFNSLPIIEKFLYSLDVQSMNTSVDDDRKIRDLSARHSFKLLNIYPDEFLSKKWFFFSRDFNKKLWAAGKNAFMRAILSGG